ncbi:hypothetical protein TNCV_4313991 [Trichonephila clavipes]|nr:hypothetical protein TNCV_4313991 [Trichonephila clavipes]
MSSSSTRPVTQECTRGIPSLLREGQVEPDGPRKPHGGKRNKTTKIFLELVAMSLETLPEYNALYDGTFPHSLHEEVHEDISYCTILPICQIPAAV